MITDNILAVVLTTALLWYNNSSDSANFKEIFDGCEKTTEYGVFIIYYSFTRAFQIAAVIKIGDVGKPNILVPLPAKALS